MSKLNAYRQTAVTTASKEQVMIMLYEGAIKHLKIASESCRKNDLSAKGTAVGKAHDIINELSNSLDFSVGGDVAKNLERLYAFMIDQITQGNISNDVAKFDQARKLLETLLDGWKGAIEQLKAEKGTKRA
ncbi:MAG: flagellar export chaperone FliS [Bdellovibrionales bacterium]|nr:flagellar export chaperone FliS [Bdellovibrionales bacterium]